MLDRLREDVRTALENDPAAKHPAEVLLYAGVHAVWAHRLEHALWERGFRLTARALSQATRFFTGVEIHPAAELGRRVFVDHGMGVVVGETAEVGDGVVMYHGVTLGGQSDDPVKRHPTVRDGATLGANATLIGPIEVGEDANVGAGSVVVDDVPAGATVVGVPAERVDAGTWDGERADGEREAANGGDGAGTDGGDATGTVGEAPGAGQRARSDGGDEEADEDEGPASRD